MLFKEDKNRSVGMMLRLLRTEKGVPLREASESIGISENYLSEIERDRKVPNDEIIKNIAVYYNVDEKALFDKFDKIPLIIQDELKEHDRLSRTLYDISKNVELDDEDKEKLYTAIEELYRSHFKK